MKVNSESNIVKKFSGSVVSKCQSTYRCNYTLVILMD